MNKAGSKSRLLFIPSTADAYSKCITENSVHLASCGVSLNNLIAVSERHTLEGHAFSHQLILFLDKTISLSPAHITK